ncbi:MAG TPA: ABC transporter permease [Thermoanaerobaculia bacterium]|nr:ABC transporter permease [Thermoanaerobaculia bacterium]
MQPIIQLWEDLRLTLRQLRAHPGFSTAIVLTLALGIGANTALFSVAESILLKRLPYAHGDALVHVVPRIPATVGDQLYFPVPEVFEYRRQSRTLAEVMEYHSMTFNLVGSGEPDRIQTGVVSANFFGAFGVTPLLGRGFRAGDDQPGADPVLLLTYDYWHRHFGGDPGIVGRRLRLNDRPILIIGVLPPLPAYPGKNQIYVPTSACSFRSSEHAKADRSLRFIEIWGRLQPGTDGSHAQAELATIAGRIGRAFPAPEVSNMDLEVVPVKEELVGTFRSRVMILLAIAGMVLLIVCANAANLTFARLLRRERELMVRAALGASWARLSRLVLLENLVSSLLGGACGCVLAWTGLGALVAFAHRFTPRADEIRLDGFALLFSLALSLLAGFVSGWLPASRALRRDVADGLKCGGERSAGASTKHHRFRDLMVTAQVGFSFALLIGAGLMVRSLIRLLQVDPGLRSEKVLTADVPLPPSRYGASPAKQAAFYQRLLTELAADPEVVAAATSSDVPMASAEPMTPSYRVAGQPVPAGQPSPRADLHVASDDYFRVLGIPLLAGRTFARHDDLGSPRVVLINRSLAHRWWPNRSALGRQIGIDVHTGGPGWRTVVGVVGDVRQEGLEAPPRPAIYVPYQQMIGAGSQVFVRTRTDPMSALAKLRAIVRTIDPDQPVASAQTLEQVRGEALSPTRLTTTLLLLFAGLGLAIAALGIGAATSFAVAERVPEIAVRMAVGADRERVLRLLLSRGMRPVLAGLACGLVAALALTRLLGGLLYGIQATDPLALAGALLVLLAIGALACYVPARRAAGLDPLTALRS